MNENAAASVTIQPKIDTSPMFDYVLQGMDVDPEADNQKLYLQEFLKENSELLSNALENRDIKEIEVFMSGFKHAISMINLWIDSLNAVSPTTEPSEPISPSEVKSQQGE